MASELGDAVRCLCIGAIGFSVSWAEGIEEWARIGIALATVGYMTGKCVVVWSKIIRGSEDEEVD